MGAFSGMRSEARGGIGKPAIVTANRGGNWEKSFSNISPESKRTMRAMNPFTPMYTQHLAGILVFCGLVAGALLAASGGCVAAGKGRAANSSLSTLAPIMAAGSGTARPAPSACAASQPGRSSKAKPTP
jgi:hypothetical protein